MCMWVYIYMNIYMCVYIYIYVCVYVCTKKHKQTFRLQTLAN